MVSFMLEKKRNENTLRNLTELKKSRSNISNSFGSALTCAVLSLLLFYAATTIHTPHFT